VKLHDDEVHTDAALVEALLADQFPELAGPVRRFASTGTVNAIFRIGDDLYARLPRLAKYEPDLHREREWLPRLAPSLSLRVPEPVALGEPGYGYPFEWGIYRWLDGAAYAGEAGESTAGGGGAIAGRHGVVADERDAAVALAGFVAELRAVPVTADAPPGGRRPLRELDAVSREALASIGDAAALAAWERALEAPPFSGAPVWIHGDLLRPNLLAAGRRLSAVIDFGSAGVGDPAADVVAAWAVFRAPGRTRFREALGVDDGTWERARGYALHQAALIVPYYADTNPGFVAHARRTIAQVVLSIDRGF
jgi:aminoglycoside phosphotransferase (APT) family kinase protein